jgi:hypothetical protein
MSICFPSFVYSGMMGSQASLSGDTRGGPQLPGLENLGADAIVAGRCSLEGSEECG